MKFQYAMIFILLSGCSVFSSKNTGREIVVNSNTPDAIVSVYSNESKQYVELGKTPLTIEAVKINQWRKETEGFVVLKISKSGYAVENLILDLNSRYKVDYYSELNALDMWNEKEVEVSSISANRLAQKVQIINQQILKKNFDNALTGAERLIEQFPKAHVFYDMKRSILLLMGKKNEAITSYQKSLNLNPDNNEAKNMLQRIQGGTVR